MIREKFEALLEDAASGEGRGGGGGGGAGGEAEQHHRSTDSAIDSDMSEYHAETLHIELAGSSEHLGFELGPGRDDSGVVVRNVTPGTAAFSKLRCTTRREQCRPSRADVIL